MLDELVMKLLMLFLLMMLIVTQVVRQAYISIAICEEVIKIVESYCKVSNPYTTYSGSGCVLRYSIPQVSNANNVS